MNFFIGFKMKKFLGRCFQIMLFIAVLLTTSHGEATMTAQKNSVKPLFVQPSMNVFRRFEAAPEVMYNFYGKVLGFKQLMTFNVGAKTDVARFQVGDSQLKLSGIVPNRTYHRGDINDATGVRLLTFFFTDRHLIEERFRSQGLPVPVFKPIAGTSRSHTFLKDPDSQWVELVIVPDSEKAACMGIEVGLSVSDIEKSRGFYREFVGLEEMPPEDDPVFHVNKYSYRHGSTIISLRCFGPGLPADTGSGGIQYVVSNAEAVQNLAKERNVVVDQPLSTLPGFSLLTVRLDDPDGITNYFAQAGVAEKK
jgi:catechol 2,3-dioxygenase-like lactoylglutathione lyase family enzyme